MALPSEILRDEDSLTVKEKEMVTEDYRKVKTVTESTKNIANGQMCKEKKLENMPLSKGM